MRAKWRLLVLLAYAGLLTWELATIRSQQGGVELLSFETGSTIFALAPVAVLCLLPYYPTALGILAILVACFGIWAYGVNGGDPIGLSVILFYQYCGALAGFVAIVLGRNLMGTKS